jgi:predicted nucleic acid-binding Zn ribbon protein
MRRQSSTKSLSAALDGLVRDIGIEQKLTEYRAITEWGEIVGEHIARQTTPTRISKGVLVVRVRTSTWRNELTLRKKEITKKINDALGADVVKEIRFQ